MASQELMSAEQARRAFAQIHDRWVSRHNPPPDFLENLFGPPPCLHIVNERTKYQTREEVAHLGRHLQDFIRFHPHHLRGMAVNPYPQVNISTSLDETIKFWIKSEHTYLMWAESRSNNAAVHTILPKIGIRICGYAHEAGLPVAIFYTYGRPNARPGSLVSARTPPVVDLVYSLIRQIIPHIPERFERPSTLTARNFLKLYGPLESVEPALEILGSLLERIPPYLVCVIEGLDKLENDETRPYLRVLLIMLRSLGRERRFKFMFITSGPSEVLSERINLDERTYHPF